MSEAIPELLERIEAAKAAVLSQVDFLRAGFGRVESHWKSDGTRVTPADVRISEEIFRILKARFPADQMFSEELPEGEGPSAVTAHFAWVLDPIDGTNNYALGIPHCAISLGLFKEGQPAYGVVYDFSRGVLMHGGPGFGMHDGGRRTRVFVGEPDSELLIGFHSPVDKRLVPCADAVLTHFKIRSLGTATLHLAYVAAGLFAGAADFNVKIWDLAAAIPLCLAAGGEVIFLNGEQLPLRTFDLKMKRIAYVAGSPRLAGVLADLVRPGIETAR